MNDPARSLEWSALRDFLAVAEAGSLSAAARGLAVSQPTLTRRMAALEESLRAELFRRTARGLELTEAGRAILGPARQMAQEAQAVELAASGLDRALSGTVRITATEGLALEWLTPELVAFHARHPRIDLEILVRNTTLNVLRREADVAIRLGRPQQAALVARRVGELALGLYASRRYLETAPPLRRPEDLARHRAVGEEGASAPSGLGGWLGRNVRGARVVYRANTLGAQRAAIRAGFGIGGQSCFIADRDPELVRVLPELETRVEIWLVSHPGLRRNARIRAVFDFLAERFAAARAQLSAPSRPAAGS